jgi:hypothetical protein
MPIPDERLPHGDELSDDDSNPLETAAPEPLNDREEEELEFETADADTNDDFLDNDEPVDRDTATFGYGDPAD